LDLTKIEAAGVASAHTKYAQKPNFVARQVKFVFFKIIVLESLNTY